MEFTLAISSCSSSNQVLIFETIVVQTDLINRLKYYLNFITYIYAPNEVI